MLLFIKAAYMKFIYVALSPLLYHLPMDSQLWLAVVQLMTYCDVYAFYIIGLVLLVLSVILLNRIFLLPKFLRKFGVSLGSLKQLSRLNFEKLRVFLRGAQK